MTTKNCIIIHGCPSDKEKAMSPEERTYNKHWMPWLKQELEIQGIKAETPLMPSPWQPVYENYREEFKKIEINENSILVGHSCGSAFLVRWLGESKQKIAKLILVAPWKVPVRKGKTDEYKQKFYVYPIDPTIKDRVGEIYMFTADNEDPGGKESLEMFQEALGGEVIAISGYGHYTLRDMGTEKFPEILEKIL